MQLIFVLLAVIGVVLILYGIFRAADSDGKKPPRDEGHGVRVGRRRQRRRIIPGNAARAFETACRDFLRAVFLCPDFSDAAAPGGQGRRQTGDVATVQGRRHLLLACCYHR